MKAVDREPSQLDGASFRYLRPESYKIPGEHSDMIDIADRHVLNVGKQLGISS